MRLFLLVALTMSAFAANSVLNRMALVDGAIDPGLFGTVRLWSGALMLAVLCFVTKGGLRLGGPRRAIGVGALLLYIYGFSGAYLVLDAGLGALILFGCVQVTMFGGGLIGGERPPARRWVGAGLAFAGLVWLLWPGAGVEVSLPHGLAMAAAGLGWGIYSLAGRGQGNPLMSTAANFCLAAPVGILIGLLLPGTGAMSLAGLALAVLSGAVTSGLGYALWYTVLPRLAPSVAAVAQLTVPPIAILGGALLLGEAPSAAFLAACGIVLGGVALSVLPLGRAR
ncbi:membrane protein [Roseivivax halodurans JCM 10272]|uniref:Membrane protein n=1 Tax=Roseivivax halodurans JCM 10272 TaxID=1449350 RepID=X7ECH9_9RHOB|nr:DMT family transporter [Roseivivax halodurans]ETX13585.1 membrane protein [Roseivivax halodurans JCM 10272]